MKKRISLIFTFIISFVLLINNVNAAKELTCIYGEGDWTQKAVKLVQEKDGTLTQYTTPRGKYLGTTETKWEKFDVEIINFKYKPKETDKYSSDFLDENEYLLSCPNCLNYTTAGKDKMEAYNTNTGCTKGFVALDDVINEALTEDKVKESAEQEIKQKMQEYKMNYCKYALTSGTGKTVELYYNEKAFHFSDGYTAEFTINDILSSSDGGCPDSLYSFYNELITDPEQFYVNKPSSLQYNRTWTLTKQENYSSSGSSNTEQRPSAPENGCQLLGDTTIGLIDDIMKVIRIIVPILLIVFGITDFFRATFSDSEDNMKKDRDRFIKRIIAAIIVFIVPMFVHLVLNIANSVWGEISPETCIK